jgi:hypothetical protein
MSSKDNQPVYFRIGADYYKRIVNQDAAGWPFEEVRTWSRQAILDDEGKKYIETIPKFDAFTNIPDNGTDEIDVLPNLYNLYTKVEHYPEVGEWPWTEILLRHVFGDQYELGLDYVQLLYQKPLQILPILCLVSRENVTGKTTFLNWLRMIFNGNIIIVGNQDIHSRFNSHYAHKLIIAVDESKIDKDASLEKLKALATQKTINYEGKFQNAQPIPFFGKFILCSNYEDNFINAKDEDIRYWVRKLNKPDRDNINIEDDLLKELPAFIHYLNGRKMSTAKRSRMWFEPKAIETEALETIRYQSKSWLFRELDELVNLYFLKNDTLPEFNADPSDVKQKWFLINSRVEMNYIRKVLKNELKLDSSLKRYIPFNDPSFEQKVGRCFTFKRSDFVKQEYIRQDNEVTDYEEINEDVPY